MNKRNTIQRELVLEAVRELGCHATADEVYTRIAKDHPTISKATVYRNLNVLSDEGIIRKLEIPGAADCYDHVCEKHCHVKCMKCGKVFDVETDDAPDLMKSIINSNGFEFLDYDIIYRGICPVCRNAQGKNDQA